MQRLWAPPLGPWGPQGAPYRGPVGPREEKRVPIKPKKQAGQFPGRKFIWSPEWDSKLRALEPLPDDWGRPREGPRKFLGSDWLPRKLLGKVTKVTQVVKCIIDHKIDPPASLE